MTENVQILINSSVFWSFWARLGDRVLGFGLGREAGFWVLDSAGRLGFGFWARPGGRVLGFRLGWEAGFWVLVTPLKTRVRG
jgi:hypothetical protein